MSESDDHESAEPVGSLAEEAAKLLGALSGMAPGGRDDQPAGADRGDVWRDLAHEFQAHVATGDDCRYCPLCQTVQLVRQTSPEVRAHLGSAAASLLRAAAGLLQPSDGSTSSSSGVEHIDLDADPDAGPEADL